MSEDDPHTDPHADLEELREVAADIERLYDEYRETEPRAGRLAIWRELQDRKAERRELVAALAREGLSPSLVAPAADLTPETVNALGSSR